MRQFQHGLLRLLVVLGTLSTIMAERLHRHLTPPEEPAPMRPAPEVHPAHALHVHAPRPHVVHNANDVHAAERQREGFNTKLAVFVTRYFGSMPAFYVLVGWMFTWMILASLNIWLWAHDRYPFQFLLFLSNLVQLWALPVIMVGQNVLSRKAEIQSDEEFRATMNTLHDAEEVRKHLLAQDKVMVEQNQMLQEQNQVLAGQNRVLQQQMDEMLKHTSMLEQLLRAVAPPLSVNLEPSAIVHAPPLTSGRPLPHKKPQAETRAKHRSSAVKFDALEPYGDS